MFKLFWLTSHITISVFNEALTITSSYTNAFPYIIFWKVAHVEPVTIQLPAINSASLFNPIINTSKSKWQTNVITILTMTQRNMAFAML